MTRESRKARPIKPCQDTGKQLFARLTGVVNNHFQGAQILQQPDR